MKKFVDVGDILLFDFGGTAEDVSKFLEAELPFKVTRIVDPRSFKNESNAKIIEAVTKAVRPYVGEAKIIVIADPSIAMTTESVLKSLFPSQRFIGREQGVQNIIGTTKQTFMLTPAETRKTELYQRIKVACQQTELIESDCSKWVQAISRGWIAQDDALRKFAHSVKRVLVMPVQTYSRVGGSNQTER